MELSQLLERDDIPDDAKAVIEDAIAQAGRSERLERMCEHSRDVIYVRRFDTNEFEFMSPSCGEVMGIPQEDVYQLGHAHMATRIHPDDLAHMTAAAMEEMTRIDAPRMTHGTFAYRIAREDGTHVWIEEHFNFYRDEHGKPSFVVGSCRRIAHKPGAAADPDELEEEISHDTLALIARSIAHDFNNLLGAIIGNAELAMSDLPDDARAKQQLATIHRASLRAAEFSQRLLKLGQDGEGHEGPIDLPELMSEVVKICKPLVRRGVHVSLDVVRPIPTIRGDATHLRRVLLNLLTNALQAIGSGPGHVRIVVRTKLLDGVEKAVLTIEDDGCGMDADVLEQIFTPFFTTKPDGTGLGLAVIRGILDRHQGDIEATSQPGEGTTFRITLPGLAS